jgi:hypothetical protein
LALQTLNVSAITIDLISHDLHITSYISSKAPEIVIAGLNPRLDMLVDDDNVHRDSKSHCDRDLLKRQELQKYLEAHGFS